MSGSKENLLQKSHLSTSKESLDGHYNGTNSHQTKPVKQGKTQGMENKGFEDDHRGLEPSFSNEIYFSHEPAHSYQKRATSLQQRPMAPLPSKEPRRHSSPDHSDHLRQDRSRTRHGGGRRRLSSNIEEDLRRKACLNSMKRYQSANPLPTSGQEAEYSYCYSTTQDKGRQSGDKIQNLDEERRLERPSMHHDTRKEREAPLRFGSSHQQDNEVQNMQQTIITLERNQLEQYKKRLTLALSERAKLAGELQMLSQSLTTREMESDRHSSESISLGSSLGRSPSSARSSRLSHSLGDLRIPEMYGDYGDISVDYEDSLRLPPVPGSAKSSRQKMEIPELDLRSLNSSFERISSDHIENLPKGKGFEKNKDPLSVEEGNEGNNKNQVVKEDLKKMVDDIWQDNLKGDVLAEERRKVKTEDKILDENTRDSDINNNEKATKKRLTVEDFLSNEDSKERPSDEKEKIQERKLNVLLGNEDMNDESRGISPELYEPVECLYRPQLTQANDKEQQHKNQINHDHDEGLLRHKVDNEKSGQNEGNLEDYFTASTLPVGKKENRKEDGDNVHGRKAETNAKSLREEPTLNENQLPARMTRIGRNDRRFNYMIPPGARTNVATNSGNKNNYLGKKETEKAIEREVQRVPSNISDKLRYYREKLSNPVEEESSRDLADAYAHEKDPEKRREIQRQAASEAAILRRKASALLFEAMNLERICDPNGRVRHRVYLPQ